MLLSTDHLFVRTDIFHAWTIQGYTRYLWKSEYVLHKSLGLFYLRRYTSDDTIATLESINANNKFSLLPPTNSRTFPPLGATGRYWAPLGATSHKMDSHRWSLQTSLFVLGLFKFNIWYRTEVGQALHYCPHQMKAKAISLCVAHPEYILGHSLSRTDTNSFTSPLVQ